MPDILVEDRTCRACGAEIRADTQYCYNCGEQLKACEKNQASSDAVSTVDDAGTGSMSLQGLSTGDSPLESSSRNGNPALNTVAADSPLQSAASLRRKPRSAERRTIEVTWEPATGSNVLLIVATVLLLLFTVVMVSLALYYR